ncbi:hypothetical protein TNCV_1439251 [Trichonephila clavipes]|nr:hypothetical protein TNCV_1439251 [Trichonephila clavipes]
MQDAFCFLALLLLCILSLDLLYDLPVGNFLLRTAFVSSLATFLHLLQFLQVVFSVETGVSSSKNHAADCKNSVVAIDEPCAAVI